MGGMWRPGTVHLASAFGIETREGYLYCGLGMVQITPARSARGRRKAMPSEWSLTHLGSGHRVCMLFGEVATVFPVATEIAELGAWADFDTLDGWRQVDPDLPAKTFRIIEAAGRAAQRGPGSRCAASADMAREVAYARA